MINYFNQDYSISFENYSKMKNGELTLNQIRKNHNDDYDMESFTGKILKNHRLTKIAVVLLASANIILTKAMDSVSIETVANGKAIDVLGNKLLGLFQYYGHWILLIMCVLECIKSGINGDSKKILAIVVKFLLIYTSLFLVPQLFDMITTSF